MESEVASEDGVEILDTSQIPASSSKKKTSQAHNHFNYLKDEKKFQCKHCKIKLTEVKSGSTSNLLRHLKQAHPTINTNPDPEDKPNILKFLASKKKEFTQAEFEDLLVDFIILSSQPFSIVEEDSFRKLILFCNPKANFVSADTIQRRILSRFETEQKCLLAKLKKLDSKISFVLDCWTSANQIPFQGIIGRWIDENWLYNEIIIDLDILSGKHTGEMLSSSFTRVLERFDLLRKIMAITTDNASNCDTFFEHLSAYLHEKGIDFDKENQRIRCLAHIINLACQDAIGILKNIQSPITSNNSQQIESDSDDDENDDEAASVPESQMSIFDKLRKGVMKIRKSTQRRETFKKHCEVSGIKHTELVKDVPTRWNSTYFMLKRAYKMKIPFDNTLRADNAIRKLALADEEWTQIGEIVTFLKPFKQLTVMLSSGDAQISVSVMVYMQLYNHLENITEVNGYSPLIVQASSDACDKLNKYYPSSDGLVYIIGTVLDPRCKLTWYTCHSSHFPTSLIKKYKTAIKSCWEENYKPESAKEVAVDANRSVQKADDLFFIQMKRAKFDKRDELQIYLDEPALAADDDQIKNGILDYWKTRASTTYPNLAKMARDFLAASGTGVPIERLFSNGTDLLPSKRQSMHGETVRKCMCLKGWIKSKNRDDFKTFVSTSLADKMLGNITDI